jgi:hypothetical protein
MNELANSRLGESGGMATVLVLDVLANLGIIETRLPKVA